MNSMYTISTSNATLIEYLIQKLNSRCCSVEKNKNVFEMLYSYETFVLQKKKLLNLLEEINEDMKQAAFAMKALLNENKGLHQEILTKEEIHNKVINELSSNNDMLIEENEKLKEEMKNKPEPIKEDVNDNEKLSNIDEEKENGEEATKAENIINEMKISNTKIKEAISNHINNTDSKENNDIEDSNKLSEPKEYNNKSNEIMIKAMSSSENMQLLSEELGKDFMQKILNNDTECINKAEKILNKQNKVPKRLKKSKLKQLKHSQSSTNSSRYKTIKESKAFERSLRDYPSSCGITQSKQFINYTTPYGRFFTKPEISNTFGNVRACGHSRSHSKPNCK